MQQKSSAVIWTKNCNKWDEIEGGGQTWQFGSDIIYIIYAPLHHWYHIYMHQKTVDVNWELHQAGWGQAWQFQSNHQAASVLHHSPMLISCKLEKQENGDAAPRVFEFNATALKMNLTRISLHKLLKLPRGLLQIYKMKEGKLNIWKSSECTSVEL